MGIVALYCCCFFFACEEGSVICVVMRHAVKAPVWGTDEIIGAGTSATVRKVLVKDAGGFSRLRPGQFVALKEIHISDDDHTAATSRRVEQEIAMMKTMRHPNVVECFGVLYERNVISIIMEYCDGNSLRHIYSKNGPLSPSIVVAYTRQMLLGLDYLHSQGIVHRDVKSLNVLVTREGVCKLADFGSATILASSSDQRFHSMQGTLWWMAPEVFQLSSKTGGTTAADIWSLGCTVWEIATARLPFPQCKQDIALMKFIIGCETDEQLMTAETTQGMTEGMVRFVRRCLRRTPSDRPTAAELLKDPFLSEGAPAEASQSPHRQQLPMKCLAGDACQDKMAESMEWFATNCLVEGSNSVALRKVFDALRCPPELRVLLAPYVTMNRDICNTERWQDGTVVTKEMFLTFLAWFGPIQCLQHDITAATVGGDGSEGEYSYDDCAYGRDYSYETDWPHMLPTIAGKPWMKALITKEEVEEAMYNAPPETFTVRFTSHYQKFPGSVTVTVKGEHGIVHQRIVRPANTWAFELQIGSEKLYFDNLEQLVEYGSEHGFKSPKGERYYKLLHVLQ